MFITGGLKTAFWFGLWEGFNFFKIIIIIFGPFGIKLTNLNTNKKYLLKKIQIQNTINLNNQIQTNSKPKRYKSKTKNYKSK